LRARTLHFHHRRFGSLFLPRLCHGRSSSPLDSLLFHPPPPTPFISLHWERVCLCSQKRSFPFVRLLWFFLPLLPPFEFTVPRGNSPQVPSRGPGSAIDRLAAFLPVFYCFRSVSFSPASISLRNFSFGLPSHQRSSLTFLYPMFFLLRRFTCISFLHFLNSLVSGPSPPPPVLLGSPPCPIIDIISQRPQLMVSFSMDVL